MLDDEKLATAIMLRWGFAASLATIAIALSGLLPLQVSIPLLVIVIAFPLTTNLFLCGIRDRHYLAHSEIVGTALVGDLLTFGVILYLAPFSLMPVSLFAAIPVLTGILTLPRRWAQRLLVLAAVIVLVAGAATTPLELSQTGRQPNGMAVFVSLLVAIGAIAFVSWATSLVLNRERFQDDIPAVVSSARSWDSGNLSTVLLETELQKRIATCGIGNPICFAANVDNLRGSEEQLLLLFEVLIRQLSRISTSRDSIVCILESLPHALRLTVEHPGAPTASHAAHDLWLNGTLSALRLRIMRLGAQLLEPTSDDQSMKLAVLIHRDEPEILSHQFQPLHNGARSIVASHASNP
ncbi:MAG: hypothetical protein KDD44_02380 [Bdellovibrionales bacterium]|nr:hypothetical protein [Bdellovibrionales bacterium]